MYMVSQLVHSWHNTWKCHTKSYVCTRIVSFFGPTIISVVSYGVGILIGIILASVRLMGAHSLLFHAQTPSSHDQGGGWA